MKRLVVLLAVMAILMLALAVPAFVMASDDANSLQSVWWRCPS
jgi:hypothetical protein